MKKGKVYLVGAGIGSDENITVKGKNVLLSSDVVVYDRLMNRKLLKDLPDHVECIDVGKESDHHKMSQEEINLLLVEKANEGKKIVRLKGGDPYVFGRGGEEGEVLFQNGIDFEVVPGITAGVAGLCYAGIPVTHREFASSFHIITGHRKEGGKELDYQTLAKLEGTLVFYMGLKNLEDIINGLLGAGKAPSTPVALISHAGYAEQYTLCSTLDEVINLAKEDKRPVSPTIIVVGEVVRLRDTLNFFEHRPLFGKRVVVTRARQQVSGLAADLTELGAEVIEMPSIRIVPKNLSLLQSKIAGLRDYTHLIFTSKNSVDIFMRELLKERDVRSLYGIKLCAIGSGTNNSLKSYGLSTDIIPGTYVAESLFEELKRHLSSSSKILFPRASMARDYLKQKLDEICMVDEVGIYDTVMEEPYQNVIEDMVKKRPDYITFTSSSTVKNTISLLNDKADEILGHAKTKIISIGPITSKTVREYGYQVYAEAKQHDIEHLVRELVEQEGKN